MGTISKPHVVCIPFPAQGHMTPMLALAKLLHSSGFHITFVNTEFNHRRLLRSHGTINAVIILIPVCSWHHEYIQDSFGIYLIGIIFFFKLDGNLGYFPDFQFMTIPDGLPVSVSDDASKRDVLSLCQLTMNNCLPHLRQLLLSLESLCPGIPKVTCIISDASMTFALDAANEIGVPCALFRFCSACAFMAYLHYRKLLEKGIFPLKGTQTNFQS